MAELEFLKGLYDEGAKRLEEGRRIGELPVTRQTTKMMETLVKLTKDGGVLSKAYAGIDKAFANDLKLINRQLSGLADSWDELFEEARDAQDSGGVGSGPPADFF